MARDILSEEQWALIEAHLPPQKGGLGRPYTGDHRNTVEGILWIARTGAPWRDLPERFGKWGTVYRRFRRWSQKGVFRQVLESLMGDLDLDVAMIDGTWLKAHQHSAGAKKGERPLRNPDAHKPSGAPTGVLPPKSSPPATETGASPPWH